MRGHNCSRWSPPRSAMASMLSVLLATLLSSCHTVTLAEEIVRVEVRHVGFDHRSNSPVIVLQDTDKKKAMPIWIGAFEAQAIALELQGVSTPRPLTHDLVKNILDGVGVVFEKVVVSELKGGTYYARIHLTTAGKSVEVDSRPSDAIALALRFHRPIFVAKGLMESAFSADMPEALSEPASAQIAGVTVQNLTVELSAYFDVPNTHGVLVSDSGKDAGEDALQRGDVIVAVNGEEVRNVADFRDKMRKGEGQIVALSVRRNGKEHGIRLAPPPPAD